MLHLDLNNTQYKINIPRSRTVLPEYNKTILYIKDTFTKNVFVYTLIDEESMLIPSNRKGSYKTSYNNLYYEVTIPKTDDNGNSLYISTTFEYTLSFCYALEERFSESGHISMYDSTKSSIVSDSYDETVYYSTSEYENEHINPSKRKEKEETTLSVTITSNGDYTITPPDSEYYTLSSVDLNVDVVVESAPLFDELNSLGYTDSEISELNAQARSDIDYSKTLTDISQFRENNDLVYAPLIDTSKVTNMTSMFSNCTSLKTVPLYNTSNTTKMRTMFYYCESLKTVPHFNTSKVTDMYTMFGMCDSINTIPLFDTSNVTNMEYMFSHCYNLTTVPLFDTSNVTSTYYMFDSCSSLITVPLFDTSKVTRMTSMFSNCTKLITIPEFDFSNVTNINSMLYNCYNLETLPNINCSKVADIRVFSAYAEYKKLTSIGKIDCTSVSSTSYQTLFATSGNRYPSLTDFGGFVNAKYNINLAGCSALTRESILNVFNEAATITTGQTITLHADVKAKMSEEDISIATNKGWTVL